jgi:hypothetical protein
MFKCNGKTWNLAFVEPYNDNLTRSDGSRTVGVTDNNTKTVYLSNLLRGKFLDKVLCHELVHVASFSYDCSIDIETEEIIADFMSLYGREIIYLADDLMKSIMERRA